MTDCDVVVIGLGPGGEDAATRLAKAGLRVVGVDERLVGGECPYYGCIPTKMMVHAAAGARSARSPWAAVAQRIRDEATDDWDDRVAVDRLEKSGVTFVRGHGRLTGPGAVEVDGRSFQASRGVLLNTGTAPSVPPIDGLPDTPYWTNQDAVRLEQLPASLAVIGAGAIGAELAQVFARFGVEVTVLEVADRMLAPEEPEAGELVGDVFTAAGIRVMTGARIERVGYADGRFTVSMDGSAVHADKLLVAAGRHARLGDLGLDAAGIDPTTPALPVDDRMRAGDRLWGIGDITGKGAFTHVSMYQAGVAVRDILGEDGPAADYRAVPRVTFTDPEVGSVGMTEQQARDAGLSVRVGTTDLAASTRGWINEARGLVKLVEDADRGVLVGATSVGPCGGEVLAMLTTAVHAEVPVETLRSMIYAYPTYHRAVEAALADLG